MNNHIERDTLTKTYEVNKSIPHTLTGAKSCKQHQRNVFKQVPLIWSQTEINTRNYDRNLFRTPRSQKCRLHPRKSNEGSQEITSIPFAEFRKAIASYVSKSLLQCSDETIDNANSPLRPHVRQRRRASNWYFFPIHIQVADDKNEKDEDGGRKVIIIPSTHSKEEISGRLRRVYEIAIKRANADQGNNGSK